MISPRFLVIIINYGCFICAYCKYTVKQQQNLVAYYQLYNMSFSRRFKFVAIVKAYMGKNSFIIIETGCGPPICSVNYMICNPTDKAVNVRYVAYRLGSVWLSNAKIVFALHSNQARQIVLSPTILQTEP